MGQKNSDRSDVDAGDALIRAAQGGDREAFRALYEQHKERVYRTALRLVGSPKRAQDVTQEVFVTLFRRLKTFDFRSALTTWLYRITVNASYDLMRRAERHARHHVADADVTTLEDPAISVWQADSGLRRSEVQQNVEEAIGRLSPELRSTFVLRETEGLSYEEIARVLDVSQGTVASRLARARQQLAAYLRSVGIDESYYE